MLHMYPHKNIVYQSSFVNTVAFGYEFVKCWEILASLTREVDNENNIDDK